ncbi:MAG: T9SS type A sorting domain-containing protein [Bacteroidales bacterium]|nr:T9SS type A sorting domain-containing protein [Bacteroidales bacterium]
MKRTFTTLLLLLFALSMAIAQQIARDKVVVEIGTGTWCVYCPGAAMGADELVANGHDVAIIENHNGDAYTNAASNARNSYYNISGYPTAVFDGGSAVVGGSNSTSMYPNYLPVYNQKIAIPASFSIDIQGSSSGLIDFNVDVTIEMVEAYSGSDIRLHCAVTESEIPEYWQGQSELNFVQRMMLPTHNGIQLDFSGGNIIEQSYSFSLDPSWVAEHCEIVIFLQEHGSKTILNGSKRELIEMGNVNNYDASISNLSNLPVNSCAGIFEPKFTLRNNGNEDLNSITFQYQVNGGALSTYNWTGNLAFLAEEEVSLPAILFNAEEENILHIYSENPNGNPDQYPLNDTIAHSVPGADIVPSTVGLILRTDANPGETSWEILDSEGTVVASGGPYTQSGQTINETFELDDLSCYQFKFYDAGGDGLESPGFFALYHGSNSYIIQGIGDFGSLRATDFSTDDETGVEEIIVDATVKVYPNPFSNYTNIAINTNEVSHIRVNMFNILGELVYQSDEGMLGAGEQLIRVNSNNLRNGVYFMQLLINEEVYTERVTITR